MATPFVLKNAKIYIDAFDLSSRSSEVTGSYEFPEVEVPCFGDDVKYGLPGIPTISLELKGLAVTGAGESEAAIASTLGATNVPVSMGYTGADGTPGYFTKAAQLSQQLGGALGEAFGFQIRQLAQGYRLVRGLYLAPRVSRSSSGNGTVRQMGAVDATQQVHAIVHVFAASGTTPTLNVVVQSDDGPAFASPITRVTFAQMTTVGSQLLSTTGPITDDYWRVGWTIAGTSPTFDFAVLVGIL